MLWEPRISPGCVFMYTLWLAGIAMITLAWVLDHSALGQAGLTAAIGAGSVTVLRDGMRTRRQISAIAKRRDDRENERDAGDTAPVGLIHPERF